MKLSRTLYVCKQFRSMGADPIAISFEFLKCYFKPEYLNEWYLFFTSEDRRFHHLLKTNLKKISAR